MKGMGHEREVNSGTGENREIEAVLDHFIWNVCAGNSGVTPSTHREAAQTAKCCKW